MERRWVRPGVWVVRRRDSEGAVVKSTAWHSGFGCRAGCGLKPYIRDDRLMKAASDEDHLRGRLSFCAWGLVPTGHSYHQERSLHSVCPAGVCAPHAAGTGVGQKWGCVGQSTAAWTRRGRVSRLIQPRAIVLRSALFVPC